MVPNVIEAASNLLHQILIQFFLLIEMVKGDEEWVQFIVLFKVSLDTVVSLQKLLEVSQEHRKNRDTTNEYDYGPKPLAVRFGVDIAKSNSW